MCSDKETASNVKNRRSEQSKPQKKRRGALNIEEVQVNSHCIGSRWTVSDIDQLARLIAIVAMGQASHAARIIAELESSKPALDGANLRRDAKQRLTVSGVTVERRNASRWHRDGLIFEVISWAAAHQDAEGTVFLKDPHISATTQGLDGLMIELDSTGKAVTRATIFEDKCSTSPRDKFRDEILPAFKGHHENKRASELVATAAALIERSDIDGTAAVQAAGGVLDKKYRAYRAGLTITASNDTVQKRNALFKDYETIRDIKKTQRIGATFVIPAELRPWFDKLANRAVAYIDTLPLEEE